MTTQEISLTVSMLVNQLESFKTLYSLHVESEDQMLITDKIRVLKLQIEALISLLDMSVNLNVELIRPSTEEQLKAVKEFFKPKRN